jgi:hypothetical protein
MRSCIFIVRLSKPASAPVSINYATEADTAEAPADFIHVSGTINFLAGDVARQISVSVRDVVYGEEDKQFKLKLTAPVGVTLDRDEAIGVIPGAPPLSQPIVSVDNPVAPSP